MANASGTGFQSADEKFGECEFFIRLMERYKAKPREFGYCLSAYLSAFKSILDRFEQTATNWGTKESRKEELRRLKKSSSEVMFLARARNVEVHHKGVRIELARRSKPLSRNPRIQRFSTRHSRFDDPIWAGPRDRTPKKWFFRDIPKTEIITLCRDSLERVREFLGELSNTGERTKTN